MYSIVIIFGKTIDIGTVVNVNVSFLVGNGHFFNVLWGGPCAWESGSIVKRLQRMVSKLHEMRNKEFWTFNLQRNEVKSIVSLAPHKEVEKVIPGW